MRLISKAQARGLTALTTTVAIASVVTISSRPAQADENGVGFWLPGQYGSLAAVPAQPGWSFATIFYHSSVSGGGRVAASREITVGKFSPNIKVDLNANLHARADAEFVNLNYVFASPVLGGQLAIGMTGAFGRSSVSVDGSLTASVGGLTTTRQGSISDSRGAIADLYPTASLRWNQGVHNYMVYGSGDIPVGTYDSSRLANLGIGHGAVDGGAGYTYFNPATGYEFSAVTGMTYNFKNPDTDYRNGIDWHLDWGLSKFISQQVHIGAVGYFYHQLTADEGQSPILGDFKSRVNGIGPQIGYLFPIADMQGYLNVKGYREFGAENRPEGWSAWVTLAISPAAKPTLTPAARSMVRK